MTPISILGVIIVFAFVLLVVGPKSTGQSDKNH